MWPKAAGEARMQIQNAAVASGVATAIALAWRCCPTPAAGAAPRHASSSGYDVAAAAAAAGVTLREAEAAADAEFIATTLLQAGRDVSEDDSPFGLSALMEMPQFQQRQLASSMTKVDKTVQQRRSGLAPHERTSCLWIAVDNATGQRVGAVGIFESTEEKRARVAVSKHLSD